MPHAGATPHGPLWAWLLKPIVPHVSGLWDLKDACLDRCLGRANALSDIHEDFMHFSVPSRYRYSLARK